MKLKTIIKTFTFLLIALISGNQIKASDLGLGVSGEMTFKLNPAVNKSELKFESTAPLEDIIGYVESSKDISSTLNFNPANAESANGTVSFKVKGLKTGIDMRDEHLYSPTWLDAGQYPEIVFGLNSLSDIKIKESASGKAVATAMANGVFKMHGKSKSINVPVSMTFLKESAATKKRAPGHFLFVEGKFQIALKDFDVSGKKGVVGSKVGEKITMEFKLFYSSN